MTITTDPATETFPSFWDLYEEELVKSVAKAPSEYFTDGMPPAEFASKVRQKMQRTPFKEINHNSSTFRRVAKRLGIKYNRTALAAASIGQGLSAKQLSLLSDITNAQQKTP